MVVVDDHELVRNTLVVAMGDQPDIDVVGTAGSIAEAIAVTTEYRPDVVILDYRLPDGDGISGARQLRETSTPPAVVMLTARDDPQTRAEAFAAGCSGFVTKGAKLDQLADAVRAAARPDSLRG